MKRLLLMVLAGLVCLCGFSFPALAEPERLTDHFSVSWFDKQNNASSLSVALIYAHEDFRYMDGILQFMPLKQFFVHDYDPPVVVRTDHPLWQVDYDAWFYDSFSESVTIWRADEDDFHAVESTKDEAVDLSSLSPGDYLIDIRIRASKAEYYFYGAGFIHLIVPGSDTSVWPVPGEESLTQTPVAVPESVTPEPETEGRFFCQRRRL